MLINKIMVPKFWSSLILSVVLSAYLISVSAESRVERDSAPAEQLNSRYSSAKDIDSSRDSRFDAERRFRQTDRYTEVDSGVRRERTPDEVGGLRRERREDIRDERRSVDRRNLGEREESVRFRERRDISRSDLSRSPTERDERLNRRIVAEESRQRDSDRVEERRDNHFVERRLSSGAERLDSRREREREFERRERFSNRLTEDRNRHSDQDPLCAATEDRRNQDRDIRNRERIEDLRREEFDFAKKYTYPQFSAWHVCQLIVFAGLMLKVWKNDEIMASKTYEKVKSAITGVVGVTNLEAA